LSDSGATQGKSTLPQRPYSAMRTSMSGRLKLPESGPADTNASDPTVIASATTAVGSVSDGEVAAMSQECVVWQPLLQQCPPSRGLRRLVNPRVARRIGITESPRISSHHVEFNQWPTFKSPPLKTNSNGGQI
jgi:hypothetical protein